MEKQDLTKDSQKKNKEKTETQQKAQKNRIGWTMLMFKEKLGKAAETLTEGKCGF